MTSNFTTLNELRDLAIWVALDTRRYNEASIVRLLGDHLIVNYCAPRFGFDHVDGWAEDDGTWRRVC